jgi:hypothetical protein
MSSNFEFDDSKPAGSIDLSQSFVPPPEIHENIFKSDSSLLDANNHSSSMNDT